MSRVCSARNAAGESGEERASKFCGSPCMEKSALDIPPDLATRSFFLAAGLGFVRLISPRRSIRSSGPSISVAEVLRRRTSLRTTSNYLKIKIWKSISVPDTGQLVPKSATTADFWVGSQVFRVLRNTKGSLCLIFDHDSRENRAWLVDGVSIGEEAPMQIGELEICEFW